MYRNILIAAAAAALAAGASACGGAPSQQSAQPAPVTASGPAPARSATAPAVAHHAAHHSPRRAAALRALTEPQAGIGPVYRLINRARTSIDLTMYELVDPVAEADLAAAARRGVNVRVILDQHLERSRNTSAYDYLTTRGVHVAWAPAGMTYHQKTLTADGRTSAIMTLNLVTDDYPDTRDFAVIDRKRADVAAIVSTFNADFAGRSVIPPDGADLVWSPTNAEESILSVINGATRTLAVENEEMGEPAVTSALENAAGRGVQVKVIMTADSEWDDALGELARAGVHIRLYPDDSSALYIHAKAIVADAGRPGQRVLVGSENFSVASLGYNRELGIVTADRAVVAAIAAVLAGDYAGGARYSPPPAPAAPKPASGGSLCGAPANPFHLTLCAGGPLVTTPPSGVCGYFSCIGNFANGTGYMTECRDGEYSMSGGREGVCTDHGGASRPVYDR
jgi:phosphatidylserine/phosphatidylglycerophosphate/cardiolipin synthase-like enzyme